MNQRIPSNVAASVAHRLRNLARDRNENVQLMLTRYGTERLLYRLGCGSASEQFVLKGAVLFYMWDGNISHRPTRDVDFLGYGDTSVDSLVATFRALCEIPVDPDGLIVHGKHSVRGTHPRSARIRGSSR